MAPMLGSYLVQERRSSSMSCSKCYQGASRPDWKPSGHTAFTHGRNTYVTEPPAYRKPKGVIVIAPGAFGWDFANNRLVDEYAGQGDFKV